MYTRPMPVPKQPLSKLVMGLLSKHPEGLKRTAIEKDLGCVRADLRPILDELVRKGAVVRVGKGPTDPNTRYVLTEYHKINQALA